MFANGLPRAVRSMLLALSLALALALAPALAAMGEGRAPTRELGPRRVVMAWPSNVGPLNPHDYAPNQMFAQAMVYEPLVRQAADGSIAPWLARSWDISPDGRIYTFRLRRDVRFSNGETFDAPAVVANIYAVLADRTRHLWLELANQIRAVEALDAHTVRLTLASAYYPALHELSLPRPFRFIAPSQLGQGGGRAPIGTGPWTHVMSRPGELDLFRRNALYWGPAPAFDEVKVSVIADANTRAIAFETGEINLIRGAGGSVSPDAFQRLRSLPEARAQLSAPLETLMFAMNSGKGPTADVAVRQAVNHAINKDVIVARVLQGVGVRADALFSPRVPYADLGLAPYSHDPVRAAALLDGAGWTMAKGEKVRSRNGVPLRLDLVFIGTDPLSRMLAEIVQASLARIGVAARLIGEEESSVQARHRDGRFHMAFHRTWGPGYDPHAFLSAMRAPSHADYQAQLGLADKAEIDAAITAALTANDETMRRELYQRVLKRLHEAAIYLPLVHVTGMSLAGRGVAAAPFAAISGEIPFEQFTPAER